MELEQRYKDKRFFENLKKNTTFAASNHRPKTLKKHDVLFSQ